MRDIKTLLELLRDELPSRLKKEYMNPGMCSVISDLVMSGIISGGEWVIIKDYFIDNGISSCAHNWDLYDLQPRLDWLNEQISKL